jgi:hypothetical protein
LRCCETAPGEAFLFLGAAGQSPAARALELLGVLHLAADASFSPASSASLPRHCSSGRPMPFKNGDLSLTRTHRRRLNPVEMN